MTYLYQSVAP